MELNELNELTTVLVFFEASLFLVNILGCFLFFMALFFFRSKKKLTILNILNKNPKRVRIYLLTFFMLIPNYIFVYVVPLYVLCFFGLLIWVLSHSHTSLCIIICLYMYLVCHSVAFGLLYDKVPTFKKKFSQFFFTSEKESEKIINFFYGGG